MADLRSNALKIAADLPVGDPTRRKLLEALDKSSRGLVAAYGTNFGTPPDGGVLLHHIGTGIWAIQFDDAGPIMDDVGTNLTAKYLLDQDGKVLFTTTAGARRAKDRIERKYGLPLKTTGGRLATEKLARLDGSLFPRNSYLNVFFNEKGVPAKTFDVTDSRGVWHSIPNEVVLEFIAQTRGGERKKIEDTIRKIDFANGDVNHFLEHLAKAIAEMYGNVF